MTMLIVVFCLGGIIFLLIHMYNSLVRLKALTQEAWSGVDVQLKRRYDLVPNLVQVVKGYAKHEDKVFEKVTKARTAAMGAAGPQAKSQAEAGFAGALKSLFAVAESYPDLKANANFLELQKTLGALETDIQLARRYYNGAVRDLNIRTSVFPSSLIASFFGFSSTPYFELSNEAEKENPNITF